MVSYVLYLCELWSQSENLLCSLSFTVCTCINQELKAEMVFGVSVGGDWIKADGLCVGPVSVFVSRATGKLVSSYQSSDGSRNRSSSRSRRPSSDAVNELLQRQGHQPPVVPRRHHVPAQVT